MYVLLVIRKNPIHNDAHNSCKLLFRDPVDSIWTSASWFFVVEMLTIPLSLSVAHTYTYIILIHTFINKING